MDLDSLRCFVAAADAPSFRAAAKKVHLSPGAFSDRLSRLEDDLGGMLFHRSSRSRRLTEAGERVLPAARNLLADADRCRELVQAADQRVPFELTIGTRYELGMSWLCPALATLTQTRPERSIHLYMADTPDLLSRVERGDLDAVVFSARLTSPRLAYTKLHTEEYIFVGPPGTRIDGAEHAAEHTLVDISPDLPLFRYLRDAQPNPTVWRFARHEYMGGIGATLYRVLHGHGVAVLPTYFVQPQLDDGSLVRLMPEAPIREDAFRLVWWKAHPYANRLEELAEELRALPLQ